LPQDGKQGCSFAQIGVRFQSVAMWLEVSRKTMAGGSPPQSRTDHMLRSSRDFLHHMRNRVPKPST
jgi:hypothetical protein